MIALWKKAWLIWSNAALVDVSEFDACKSKGVPQGPVLSPATFVRMNTNDVLPFLDGHIHGELVRLSSWLPESQFLLSLSKVNQEIVVSKQQKANVESPTEIKC